MLAVTANWLLTDGSLAPACAAGADAWIHAIRRAVIRAGFRRDGRYAPIESVTLVFAGDTFDWLLSDVWSGRDRPWHAGPRSRAARSTVVAASLRAARPVLKGLRRWSQRGIPVPAVDAHGRPSAHAVHHAPVQMVMLAGDRDAWAGEAFLFRNDPRGRARGWVGESWSDGEVTIRHGHDRDPVTHAVAALDTWRAPALAESIAVDLVVPFAMALKADTALWHLARPHIRALAASPVANMPQAVARLVRPWGVASPPGRRVLMMWRRSVMEWKKSACREPPVTETEHDAVGPAADWLEASMELPSLPVPEAIASLSTLRPDAEAPSTILGHSSIDGTGASPGPWLRIIKPTRTLEPLGKVRPGPPVVTIGETDRHHLVEAA